MFCARCSLDVLSTGHFPLSQQAARWPQLGRLNLPQAADRMHLVCERDSWNSTMWGTAMHAMQLRSHCCLGWCHSVGHPAMALSGAMQWLLQQSVCTRPHTETFNSVILVKCCTPAAGAPGAAAVRAVWASQPRCGSTQRAQLRPCCVPLQPCCVCLARCRSPQT